MWPHFPQFVGRKGSGYSAKEDLGELRYPSHVNDPVLNFDASRRVSSSLYKKNRIEDVSCGEIAKQQQGLRSMVCIHGWVHFADTIIMLD